MAKCFYVINVLPRLQDLRVRGRLDLTSANFDALFTPGLLRRQIRIAFSKRFADAQEVDPLKMFGSSLVQVVIENLEAQTV